MKNYYKYSIKKENLPPRKFKLGLKTGLKSNYNDNKKTKESDKMLLREKKKKN